MNYKKSIILSALSLGVSIAVNAQSPQYSLNGLGRSIISDNDLSGASVESDETIQKANISGYNLFDLQTNLDLDSTFNAKVIFRTRSPFGTSFGSKTDFEFRLFSMGGNLNGLKYQLGDIRVELTPYTVFNADLAGTGYESSIFTERREILEYENFNDGNTWLLQGASGQYGWNLGDEAGIGIYAFTTRLASTNELGLPDRMLSGGRVEYALNKSVKIGVNDVGLYDIQTGSTEYDYTNNVVTGDINSSTLLGDNNLAVNLEFGGSWFSYTQNANDSNQSYTDMIVDLDADYNLKNAGLDIGLGVKMVGASFMSPTAQSRRYMPTASPMLFEKLAGESIRSQLYYDQFTSEEVYNNSISPTLMTYNQFYNALSPYGEATPNRFVVDLSVATDSSNHSLEAGINVNYGSEVIGQGGNDLRNFMVIDGGTNLHIGNLINIKRLIDVNVGARYENITRDGLSDLSLNNMLFDFGVSGEVFKRIDLLAGLKYYAANGNEFIAVRDEFNLVSSFIEYDVDISELIYSAGLRFRFSKAQSFNINYNMASFVNNLEEDSQMNISQLFFNYTGRF